MCRSCQQWGEWRPLGDAQGAAAERISPSSTGREGSIPFELTPFRRGAHNRIPPASLPINVYPATRSTWTCAVLLVPERVAGRRAEVAACEGWRRRRRRRRGAERSCRRLAQLCVLPNPAWKPVRRPYSLNHCSRSIICSVDSPAPQLSLRSTAAWPARQGVLASGPIPPLLLAPCLPPDATQTYTL